MPLVRMLKLAETSVNSIMPPLPPPALDRLTLTDTAEPEVPAEDEQWTEVRRRKPGRFVKAPPPPPASGLPGLRPDLAEAADMCFR